MYKTPIQQAIVHWKKQAASAKSREFQSTCELFIGYFESLLPKEKEFVNRVWNAGATSGYDNKRVHGTSEWDKEGHAANFIDFINQLYPKS